MKHMFVIRLRLKRAVLAAGLAVAAGALGIAGLRLAQNAAMTANAGAAYPADCVILLDAGHGGEDGGAIGIDGLVEKDLNLAITLKLNRFLQAMGYQTQLTRDSDTDLHAAEASTLRERKTSDIRTRHAMMEALPEAGLFVSIHQNKFGQQSAHGTQVFYAPGTPASATLAQCIQQRVAAQLQPENHRQIKPSGDEIYLLYHANRTAVLVECGFISNYEEAAKLRQEDYQAQMAFAIALGILDFRC